MSIRKIVWPIILSALIVFNTVAQSTPRHNSDERLERPYPLRLDASPTENASAHQTMRHLAHDLAVALQSSSHGTLSDAALRCIDASCRAINTLTADTIYSWLNTPTADRALMGGVASTMAFLCLNQIAPQLSICGKTPTIAAILSTTILALGALIQFDQRRLDTSLLEGANRYEASHREASKQALIATFLNELRHYGYQIPNPTPQTGFIEERNFGTWLTSFLINQSSPNDQTRPLPLDDRTLFNLFRPENTLARILLTKLTAKDFFTDGRFGQQPFRAGLEQLARQFGGRVLVKVDVENHPDELTSNHFHERAIILTFTVIPGVPTPSAELTPLRTSPSESQSWLDAASNRSWTMRAPIWALPQTTPEAVIMDFSRHCYQIKKSLRYGAGLLFRAHELLPNSLPNQIDPARRTGVRIEPFVENTDACNAILGAPTNGTTSRKRR